MVVPLAMATTIASNLVSVACDGESPWVLDDHLAFAVDMQGRIRNAGVILGGTIVAFKAIGKSVFAVFAASRWCTVTAATAPGARGIGNGTILAAIAMTIKIAALTRRIGARRAAPCTKYDLSGPRSRIEHMVRTEHIGGFVVTIGTIEGRHHLRIEMCGVGSKGNIIVAAINFARRGTSCAVNAAVAERAVRTP